MTSKIDKFLREAPYRLEEEPTIASFRLVQQDVLLSLELAQRIDKTQALDVDHRRLVLGRLMLALRREMELGALLKPKNNQIQFAAGGRRTAKKQLADFRRDALSFILNEAPELKLGVTNSEEVLAMARTWDPNRSYFPVRV